MGRMHSKGKGMSGSALPYKRTPPSWLKITGHEVRSFSTHQLPGHPSPPLKELLNYNCLEGVSRA